MRTTLTLDDDVSAQLEKLSKTRDVSWKQLVNEALRRGLQLMTNPPKPKGHFHTTSVDLGPCLVGNLDNTAEVLAAVEGESWK